MGGAGEYGSRRAAAQRSARLERGARHGILPALAAPPVPTLAFAGFEPGPPLTGALRPPGSKSLAQRLLVLASLCGEETRLTGLPDGADVQAALGVARACAAELRQPAPAAVVLRGVPPGPHRGWQPAAALEVGESGTLARLSLAALACCGHGGAQFELRPSGTLTRRSSPALVRALRRAGVALEALSGGAPEQTFALRVRPLGPPSEVALDAPGSSQEVSALLCALAAFPDEIELAVHGAIPSRPYLDLTLAVLARWGVALREHAAPGGTRFLVRGPLRAPALPWAIEPDASSAAVALCAACLSDGELEIPGLDAASAQGDVRIVEHLAAFGCRAGVRGAALWAGGAPQRAASLDLAREPDLAPALAAVAAAVALRSAPGGAASRLTGLDTLPGKESSRIAVLAQGLGQLGLAVAHDERSLTIGPRPGPRAVAARIELDPHGDHRMAFAFGLLGLVHPGLRVRDPGCVAKSWPGFWRELAQRGARLATEPS